MKMKKLVALGAAAAMSMTMCVNVFADSEVKNAVNAGYAGAQASYTGTISAANGTQMTVVVFKAIDENKNVSDTNIEYINQDTASAALYTDMGTKNNLLAVGEDGSATYAGNYVIRVGYYNAEGAWNVAEGTFTIGTKAEGPTTRTLQLGDVNFVDGIGTPDVNAILNHMTGYSVLSGDALLVADANQADGIGTPDVNAVLNHMTGYALLGTITVENK